MVAARQQWAEVVAEQAFASDGDGIQRGAVKGAPHGDRLVPAGGVAREFHGHADGGCAPRRKQHAAEVARC